MYASGPSGLPLLILIMLIITPGCGRNRKGAPLASKTGLFQKVHSESSGIDFRNKIEPDIAAYENVFDFDYFYNGAGVGISDLNNDDLPDIVFTANQGRNEIYLNLGDLTFENITEKSGINHNKGWATGITFADVNNDGWQDIYVSQGGPHKGRQRRNLLFINQKDMTFEEMSGAYGLADGSISSQAAFFDYDKDGDLDCMVMNENPLYGVDPGIFFDLLEKDEDLLHYSSGHLYENQKDRFVDVTTDAGLLYPSFGLGLMVSDINSDSWPDIYIANDYYIPDLLYINQGNGTFKNRVRDLTGQLSFFGMGIDVADINNDSHQEIFVLDMASEDHYRAKTLMASMNAKAFDLLVNTLGMHYQYMFNSFQLNRGNGKFQNIAQLTGLSKTDWSWTVLMADFNNSGFKDIYITNGYRKYALDNDVRVRVLNAKRKYKGNVPLSIKQEIYDAMPSEKLSNVMYENKGNLNFEEVAEEWGLDHRSFSNGAAYSDLDRDGDLDLVVSNIDDKAFLYRNLSMENETGNYLRVKTVGNSRPSLAKVTIKYNGEKQFIECKSVRGYLSSSEEIAHFGLGGIEKIDTVKVVWPSGKVESKYYVSANRLLTFYEKNAEKRSVSFAERQKIFDQIDPKALAINYRHIENDFNDFDLESLLLYKQSTLGPYISVGDVNGDGLDDFYIGGALNQSGQLYTQTRSGKFEENTSLAIRVDAVCEDMGSIFLDIDNDGDQDLFVISGGYEFLNQADEYSDRLYINDGAGRFDKAVASTLAEKKFSGKTICTIDYNQDGYQDLVIGNRIVPGNYPKAPRSFLYENTGSNLVDVTDKVIPGLDSFGMVNKIIATDFDQDGFEDLIVVGEWTHIGLFKNVDGFFKDVSADSGLDKKLGWWFTIKETDANKDGLKDYIVGNIGLNSKYKADAGSPLKIYASDFDENQSWDIVLSNKYKGNYVPFRGRECSSNQMPFITKQFPTYDLFAKATIEDIYGDKLMTAFQKEVNEFRSVLLINEGKSKFRMKELPVEAQIAPILDCEAMDVNHDGFEDIIIAGTILNTEVETPRLDAGAGLLLIADKKGYYRAETPVRSGIHVEGNIKSLTKIKIKGTDHLIFGRNDDKIALLKLNW